MGIGYTSMCIFLPTPELWPYVLMRTHERTEAELGAWSKLSDSAGLTM